MLVGCIGVGWMDWGGLDGFLAGVGWMDWLVWVGWIGVGWMDLLVWDVRIGVVWMDWCEESDG